MLLKGIPLVAHSIIQAKKSQLFDTIAVSSDSDELLDISLRYGADCAIKRPDELSGDHAPKISAIRHCVEQVEIQTNSNFDICVDLDCTSPLRTKNDLIGCLRLLNTADCSNVITGTPSKKSPYFNIVEVDENQRVSLSKSSLSSVTRRQDSPLTYDMNASIYAWKREFLNSNTLFLERTKLYVMPEERSIDIDSDIDFKLVSLLMESGERVEK